MIKKTALAKIATLLKIDPAKLDAAVASDKDEDIDIADDLTVFNKAELDTLKRNTYDPAKKAGEEMLIKELKKKHSLDFVGEDPEKFIEAIQKKVRAELDINPDARIVELQKDVDKTKNLLVKATEKADKLELEKESFKADSELLGMLPKNRVETMTDSEFLMLTKSNLRFEVKNGKKVTFRNGEEVLDPKTAEPIAPEKVLEGFFTERKWIKEAAPQTLSGRGGGNSMLNGMHGKYAKVSQFKTDMEGEKININGEEYTKRLLAAQKDNPEMDMNS